MTLHIDNLSKSYRSGKALKSVFNSLTLKVEPGEFLALGGANGSGKTTLLKVIATLIIQDGGRAEVNSWDTLKNPMEARMSLGSVFESERSAYQMLTIYDNLLFYAGLLKLSKGDVRIKIEELLEEFGIEEYRNIMFGHASSGTKQKFAIARLFLSNPPLLLLDEPAQGLDAASKKYFLEKISRVVKKHNRCCIWATHDGEELKGVADRYARLEAGMLL